MAVITALKFQLECCDVIGCAYECQGRHSSQGSQGLVLAYILCFNTLIYKKQPVKTIWGRLLDLAWLKFAVVALNTVQER